MKKKIIVLFFLLIKSTLETCYFKSESNLECLLCLPDYFSENLTFPLKNTNVCAPKISTEKYEKEIYVSNLNCINLQECNGELLTPYDNLITALIETWKKIQKYKESIIKFYLVSTPHFLFSPLNYDLTILQNMLRRLNSTIIISSLNCENNNVKGCFNKNNNEMAQIILKTTDINIFISGNLFLYDLIIDGSDLNYHLTYSENYKIGLNYTSCSEQNLYINSSDIIKQKCFIKGKELIYENIFNNQYGFFNFEIIQDCNSCLIPKLELNNVKFYNLFSFKNQTSNKIFYCLINGFNQLNFYLNIINSTFENIFFYGGLINLVEYKDQFFINMGINTMIYMINKINRTIIIQKNTFINLNFFEFVLKNIETKKIGLFNLYLGDLENLLAESNFYFSFYENIFANNTKYFDLSIFIFDIKYKNSFKYFKIILEKNIFNKNSLKELLFCNSSIPLIYSIILQDNTFQTNIYLSIILNNINFFLNSNIFQDTNIQNPLFILYGNVEFFINGTIFRRIYTFSSNFSSSLFNLKQTFSKSLQEIFGVPSNFSTISIVISQSKFSEMNVSILIDLAKIIKFIKIEKSIFENLFFVNMSLNLIHVNYELFFKIEDIYMNNVISNEAIFFFDYAKDFYCFSSIFENMGGKFLDVLLTPTTDTINNLIFFKGKVHLIGIKYINSFYDFIGTSLFFIRSFNENSNPSLIVRDIFFYNITGISLSTYVDYDLYGYLIAVRPSFNFSVTDLIFKNIKYSGLIYITMGSNPLTAISYYNGTIFNINVENFVGNKFILLLVYDNLLIQNLFVYNVIILDKISAMNLKLVRGFLKISDSIFNTFEIMTLFFVNAPLLINFFVGNCSFENFKIKDSLFSLSFISKIESNLTLSFIPNSDSYGMISLLINNSIGCIINVDKGQLFLKDIKFSNLYNLLSAPLIVLKDETELILINNEIINSKSLNFGGCFYFGLKTIINLINVTIENSESEYGGVIYMRGDLLIINNSLINNTKALEGGVIYSQFCEIIINSTYFGNSLSLIRGGHFYAKNSYLSIYNSIFENSKSFENGASIFSDLNFELKISNTTFFNCTSLDKSVVHLDGMRDSFHSIELVNFIKNNGERASCIMMEEGYLKLFSTQFLNNIAFEKNLIEIVSRFQKANLEMKDVYFENNSCGEILFFLKKVETTGNNLILKTNSVENNYFFFQNSNISINNFIINHDSKFQLSNYSYLINAEVSEIYIYNSSFYGGGSSSCFHLEMQSILLIELSTFESFNNYNEKEAGVLTIINSRISINDSIVLNNYGLFSGSIYVENSNSLIMNTLFINNTSEDKGANIYLVSINFNFNNFTSYNNQYLFCKGNYIYLNGGGFSNFINNSFFANTSLVKQAIILEDFENLALINCIFNSFITEGAIQITSTMIYFIEILIKNSNFTLNSNQKEGGALSLEGYFQGIIENCIFLENKALSAGAINLLSHSKECSLILSSNSFIKNIAVYCGGVLRKNFEFHLRILNDNIFSENKALIGVDTFGYPNEIMIFQGFETKVEFIKYLNENKLSYESIKKNDIVNLTAVSGQSIKLYAVLIDNYLNIDLYENGTFFIEQKVNDQEILIENSKSLVEFGIGNYIDLIIIGKPGSIIKLIISFSNKLFSASKNFEVFLRLCEKGECFLNNKCIRCEIGTFSLSFDPITENITKCENCPNNGFCFGKDFILAKRGYYRLNENSSVLIECPEKEACPDQNSTFSKEFKIFNWNISNYYSICSRGYRGILCKNCELNFGKTDKTKCLECISSAFFYIRFIFSIWITLLIILYNNREALKRNELGSYERILLRIMINHSYYLSYISKMGVTWDEQFSQFTYVNDEYATSVPKGLFNMECLLNTYFSKEDIFYIESLFYTISPIIIFICATIMKFIILLIYHFLQILSKLNKLKNRNKLISLKDSVFFQTIKNIRADYFLLFIIVVYNLYSRILIKSLDIITCVQFGDSQITYLESNPEIICNLSDPNYNRLVLTVLIPNCIIWVFGWPTLILIFLWTQRKSDAKRRISVGFNLTINQSTVMESSSFLEHQSKKILRVFIFDYSENTYFWEVVFYFLNILVTFTLILTQNIQASSQGFILLSIFLLATLITDHKKPYRKENLNTITEMSYFIVIVTIAFAVLLTSPSTDNLKLVSFLFIFLLNVGFYSLIIFLIIYSKYSNNKHRIKSVISFISKFQKRKKF